MAALVPQVGVEPTELSLLRRVTLPVCPPGHCVKGGARTHDRLDHNQVLYQLSYNHHVSRNTGVRTQNDWLKTSCVTVTLYSNLLFCEHNHVIVFTYRVLLYRYSYIRVVPCNYFVMCSTI
jgi:hypothetical protein